MPGDNYLIYQEFTGFAGYIFVLLLQFCLFSSALFQDRQSLNKPSFPRRRESMGTQFIEKNGFPIKDFGNDDLEKDFFAKPSK